VEDKRAIRDWFMNKFIYVGFAALTAVVMKSYISWDIMPCSLLKVNRRFRRTRKSGLVLKVKSETEHQADE
jgi:hypothetical protein